MKGILQNRGKWMDVTQGKKQKNVPRIHFTQRRKIWVALVVVASQKIRGSQNVLTLLF